MSEVFVEGTRKATVFGFWSLGGAEIALPLERMATFTRSALQRLQERRIGILLPRTGRPKWNPGHR
jgi:hypothetical protein